MVRNYQTLTIAGVVITMLASVGLLSFTGFIESLSALSLVYVVKRPGAMMGAALILLGLAVLVTFWGTGMGIPGFVLFIVAAVAAMRYKVKPEVAAV